MIKRATFLLYNDAKIMPERNKYLEIDALKDTWGKTNGTFSRKVFLSSKPTLSNYSLPKTTPKKQIAKIRTVTVILKIW